MSKRIPPSRQGLDIASAFIEVYDDVERANALAAQYGTYAKHSNSKFENPYWKTFSIVRLPDELQDV